MKKCIVCKHETKRDTATCPKCGEDSFGLPYPILGQGQAGESDPEFNEVAKRNSAELDKMMTPPPPESDSGEQLNVPPADTMPTRKGKRTK